MNRYVYPKLPAALTTPFFRIGGTGLANGLFVYGKAIITAQKYNAKIIAPQWVNISPGTYIRHQVDKRHYNGIFHHQGEIAGFKKEWLLAFGKKTIDVNEFLKYGGVKIESGIYDFFTPLLGYHKILRTYIENHLNNHVLEFVNSFDFSDCVAVHVRLGDFPQERRVPLDWYKEKINVYARNRRVLLFSDGKDDELLSLLSIPRVERANFGGAIQDMIAISRCGYLIGSDSSFSSWGAFLGQVPCCFYRLQFGNFLDVKSNLINENENFYK